MKKTVRTVALLAVLCLAATACQKEAIVDVQPVASADSESHNVLYIIDGSAHSTSFSSEEEWLVFLDRLVALAEEGRTVSFRNAEPSANTKQNREIVTYTTRDHNDAVAWSVAMERNGFKVTIDFNQNTGVYTCTAVR